LEILRLELLSFTFYPQGITYGTRCRFKIKYIGDDAAVIDPRRISGITREGQIVPGSTDEKPFILTKGETENINVKILSGSQANIVWNDAFKPAKIVKIDSITLDFEQDTIQKITKIISNNRKLHENHAAFFSFSTQK
jgi:hypothetical protein